MENNEEVKQEVKQEEAAKVEQTPTEVPLTPEQQQEKDYKDMQEFIANPDNRENALGLAAQIRDTVGGKWFSLDDLVRKSSETRMSAYQKLKMCEMFDLAMRRIGDATDERKHLREPLFKIIISLQDQIEGMKRVAKYHRDQADAFELSIKGLQLRLEEETKKQKEKKEAAENQETEQKQAE